MLLNLYYKAPQSRSYNKKTIKYLIGCSSIYPGFLHILELFTKGENNEVGEKKKEV